MGPNILGRWRRASAVASLAAAALILLPQPADGATAQATLVREAWYQAPVVAEAGPLCGAPTGCNPTRPGGYPDDTLHVGNLNGSTSEFTVVTFDRSAVPPTSELMGGTAVFPVADELSGTLAADSAAIVACLVVESFEEVDGAPASEAPRYDCSVRAVATYDASATPPSFTVDLTPFASAWDAGTGQGVALVPDSADTGSWHVAFSGREREGDGIAPPPTAELVWRAPSTDEPTVTEAGQADSGTSTSAPDRGTDSTPAVSSGGRSAVTTVEPSRPRQPDPVVAEPAAEPATPLPSPQDASVVAAQSDAVAAGYAYRWAWLLPLVVLIVGGSLTRSLATEVRVVPADAPRGLRARLWLALWPED